MPKIFTYTPGILGIKNSSSSDCWPFFQNWYCILDQNLPPFRYPIASKAARKFYSSQRFVPPWGSYWQGFTLFTKFKTTTSFYSQNTQINHHKLKHVESSDKKLIELMSPLIGQSSHWWQTRYPIITWYFIQGGIMQLSVYYYHDLHRRHVALWREIQIPLNSTPGLFLSLAIPDVSDHSHYQGSEGHHTGNDDEKIPVIVLRKPYM